MMLCCCCCCWLSCSVSCSLALLLASSDRWQLRHHFPPTPSPSCAISHRHLRHALLCIVVVSCVSSVSHSIVCVCVSSACVSIVWDQDTALCVLTVHYGTALPRAHTVEGSSQGAHHSPGAALRAPWPPLHGLTFECAWRNGNGSHRQWLQRQWRNANGSHCTRHIALAASHCTRLCECQKGSPDLQQ